MVTKYTGILAAVNRAMAVAESAAYLSTIAWPLKATPAASLHARGEGVAGELDDGDLRVKAVGVGRVEFGAHVGEPVAQR